MSDELTQRLLEGASELLSQQGARSLTIDSLARHQKCGKAGIYRRWRSVSHLVADMILDLELVPVPQCSGVVDEDLASLLPRWSEQPSGQERAVAAAISWSATDPIVRDAVDQAITVPIGRGIRQIVASAQDHGRPVGGDQMRRWRYTVEALWWQRLSPEQRPWSPADLGALLAAVTAHSSHP